MAQRRRKWKAPNNPTRQARQVWSYLFLNEPWPKWRVSWVGFMRGSLGLTLWDERRVLLSWGDHARRNLPHGAVETLIHEFVHVRCPELRHGQEFTRLENGLRVRLGFEPWESSNVREQNSGAPR